MEQLSLRMVPVANLLSWLTKPTGPHLNEADSASESTTVLAILMAPEVLYDATFARVGIGFVYKAPYIQSTSFSEAYFNLKCTSEVEQTRGQPTPASCSYRLWRPARSSPTPLCDLYFQTS